MKSFLRISLSFLFLVLSLSAWAQEDLLNLVPANTEQPVKKAVLATFKTSKIVNAQSTETVKAHTLDVRITHRFGNMGVQSNGGAHTLYGFDNAANIRISFDYGITNKLTVGVGRSKRYEMIDAMVKYRFLEQTTDDKIPVSVVAYEDIGVSAQKNSGYC